METECFQRHYKGHLSSSADQPVPNTQIQNVCVQPLWLDLTLLKSGCTLPPAIYIAETHKAC